MLLKQLEEEKVIELLKLQFGLAVEARSKEDLTSIMDNLQKSLIPEGYEKAKKAEDEKNKKVLDNLDRLESLFGGGLDEF